ncbi:MAG: molybdenum transporter, periplasmic molybdate-binding protein [Anaerocolumna sp.]|jgi:molybdate transport system substrate-binding protein|nr:molybdenum transporter, periplasmic molybdate-binding protein [Anaerocolumna sp.]
MKKMKKALLLAIFMIALITVGCGLKNGSKSTESTQKAETLENTNTESTTEPTATEAPDPTKAEPVELLVAAAASLQNAMEELQILYKAANPDVTLTFTFGSSGTLQQQIEQGAPVDVFMSAALKQMKALEDGGLILTDTKKELLENKIVLIVPKDSDLEITSFEDILKAPVIALGEPSSVPVGQYSEEVFTYLGILDKVMEKVTYGKDVTEVLTWVATGNADAGVVYATDAKSSDDVTVVAEAPAESTSKVLYPVAVIKDTKVEEAAKAFVEYLASEEAIGVFEEYGFTVNK